jgi:dihydroorotate dehydrogenase
MGGVASFDQLIEQIRAGQAYINVHTQAFPAGEVRGIIK